MAQGLPDDGRIVTCEFLQKHADVARANVDAAGVGHKVDIRVGAALDTLPTLVGQESFDFVFIDAIEKIGEVARVQQVDNPADNSNPNFFDYQEIQFVDADTLLLLENDRYATAASAI